MVEGPVRLVPGAPTRENLEFSRNWKESGDFRRAMLKGIRYRMEQERRQGAKDLDEMTYYFKGEKPYCLNGRVITGGGGGQKTGSLRSRPASAARAWVEVKAGRWRLVEVG